MSRPSYLVDTDILIDWLKGKSWARDLIWSTGVRVYYSNVTRKELLAKRGLSATERRKIHRLLRQLRIINVDPTIAAAASELLQKYQHRGLRVDDALIAATAWVKKLPLITRNHKHYEFIEEIELGELSLP